MDTRTYPQSKGGIHSRYINGVLTLMDSSGNSIIAYDPINKKVTIPSGATLELAAGSIASFNDEILEAPDMALANSKILVGDAGGAAAAVTMSGDATIANTGVITIENLAVTSAKLAAAVTTMINGLRTYLLDGLLQIGTLVISAAPEKFKTTTTAIFTIAGLPYTKTATDNLVFSAANTINTGAAAGDYWGAWLVQINAAGAISTKPAGGLADQVYASEAAAIAALPAVDASNVQLGYITVEANNGADWVANTDDLTAASDCQAANFYDLPGAKTIPAAL